LYLTIDRKDLENVVRRTPHGITVHVKLEDEGVMVDAWTGEGTPEERCLESRHKLYTDFGVVVTPENPPQYNHMLDVAFTVISPEADWEKVPIQAKIDALETRVDLKETRSLLLMVWGAVAAFLVITPVLWFAGYKAAAVVIFASGVIMNSAIGVNMWHKYRRVRKALRESFGGKR
jgi:hypothetical protein